VQLGGQAQEQTVLWVNEAAREDPWQMLDSMVGLTTETIAKTEPKEVDHTAEIALAKREQEAAEEKKAIQEARNELLELEPVPVEKNALQLDNIEFQHSSDNVNTKMLELMEENNGGATTIVEQSLAKEKRSEDELAKAEQKEKEADEALAKETEDRSKDQEERIREAVQQEEIK